MGNRVRKKKGENRSLTIWLIIALCGAIVGLVWLRGRMKYERAVVIFSEEIVKLRREIEELKKMDGEEEETPVEEKGQE